ncbi:TetR/AcrR family transcriptional regulator C-terminal domain-containing protein [Streptomyces cinnamoneus]|uniref:TetR/AcrR family transcriptional regulator C-terminal domain-containing protein n=1 Tax=Streptomyces cinnamoneus TaxID=53446 RepID=UPI001EFCEA65|nr:TetR/AcrR family transcriptional regulator C-terminal domain-containing protein [Streptomyces cinnamoneus]
MTDELKRLLWGPHPQPRRGPKPALSLDGIARAGVAIADAEGLPALSMQRVAEHLGKTKMSLYRYVPGRAELVALMVEAAIGAPPEPDAGVWRARLTNWSHALSAVFAHHPWLLDVTVGPRLMGPNELAWMERALAALEGLGLTGGERMDAVVLLTGHVRGIALQSRAAGAGGAEAQLVAALGEVMREHGDGYPSLLAAMASSAEPLAQDQALAFGLERILDGLEVLIARRAGGSPAGS